MSLLTIESGVFEVVATNGDTHLGGEDFDQRVMDYFIKLWKSKNGGKDVAKDKRAVQKLRREVEQAKRILSSAHQASITIENFADGKDLEETLTRAKFEELNNDLFKKTLGPVQKVLDVRIVFVFASSVFDAHTPLLKLSTGRQVEEEPNQRSRPCRRFHPYPQGQGVVEGILQRKGAQLRSQPR